MVKIKIRKLDKLEATKYTAPTYSIR